MLADVLPGERERLHARYAVALEASQERDAPMHAAIAHHWTGAREPRRALPAWIRAMRAARTALAYGSAAQYGEQALSLWPAVDDAEALAGMPRLELVGRTATALRNAGEVDRSLSLVRAGLEECEPGSLDEALLLNSRGRSLALVGRDGAIASFRRALTVLDGLGDGDPRVRPLRASAQIALAGRLMLVGLDEEGRELADVGTATARELGDRALESTGVNIAALTRGHLGMIDEAFAGMERARDLADAASPARLR